MAEEKQPMWYDTGQNNNVVPPLSPESEILLKALENEEIPNTSMTKDEKDAFCELVHRKDVVNVNVGEEHVDLLSEEVPPPMDLAADDSVPEPMIDGHPMAEAAFAVGYGPDILQTLKEFCTFLGLSTYMVLLHLLQCGITPADAMSCLETYIQDRLWNRVQQVCTARGLNVITVFFDALKDNEPCETLLTYLLTFRTLKPSRESRQRKGNGARNEAKKYRVLTTKGKSDRYSMDWRDAVFCTGSGSPYLMKNGHLEAIDDPNAHYKLQFMMGIKEEQGVLYFTNSVLYNHSKAFSFAQDLAEQPIVWEALDPDWNQKGCHDWESLKQVYLSWVGEQVKDIVLALCHTYVLHENTKYNASEPLEPFEVSIKKLCDKYWVTWKCDEQVEKLANDMTKTMQQGGVVF